MRSAVEFVGEQGHIAGALNCRLTSESRIAELGMNPIARPSSVAPTVARRGRRPARCGFANARVMRGGMTMRLSNGWPVEGQSSHRTGKHNLGKLPTLTAVIGHQARRSGSFRAWGRKKFQTTSGRPDEGGQTDS